jgi:N-acetylmuramoyl-L-alanine amidase
MRMLLPVKKAFAGLALMTLVQASAALVPPSAVAPVSPAKALPAVKAIPGSVACALVAVTAGFTATWNPLTLHLRCVSAADTLDFSADNHFYFQNRTLFQLPVAPHMAGGTLVLPGVLATAVFNPFFGGRLQWQPAQNAVTMRVDTIRAAAAADTSEITEPAGKTKKSSADKVGYKPGKTTIKVIVVDPGHGGADPGAIGPDNILEKDVVLKIALDLRDLLKDKSDCTVFMTRDKDEFVPLRDRTKFANAKKADLFVSIHANSIGGNKQKKSEARGYKVYFLSQAKNEEDKLVAMTENAVVELEQKPQDINFLQNIIVEMMNNEYLTESQNLSILMEESLAANLKKVPKLNTGIGQAPFWVLNGAYMPSVLVETAFISNPQEEKLLADPSFQKKIASALFDAIIDFRNKFRAD